VSCCGLGGGELVGWDGRTKEGGGAVGREGKREELVCVCVCVCEVCWMCSWVGCVREGVVRVVGQ
jgi:hypothetical protein